jgi:SNF2 family DNA or RNA helicase
MVVHGPPRERAWQWAADAHVTIVGYETLRSDFTSNPQSAPRRHVWGLVVLDEAQKIKNRDVEVAQACKQLDRHRSWAMTGTPLENRLEDLASILEFVDHVHGGEPVRYGPNPTMLERHRQLQLRRRKADVLLDLPPKQVVTLSIPLSPEQQQTYERAEQAGVLQLRERGEEVRIQHVLELVLRLKQICNFCPRTGESAKLDDIRDRMEVLTAEGHRALVFSQFTDETFGVEAVRRALASCDPLVYVGSMSSNERDRVIQQFKDEPQHQALVLSLRAGGVGLNLQEASYVFHLDRWWNPAIERQAEDRTHRMGQVYPVTVFKYTAIGTIEERINDVLSEKQKLFDEVVDDVSLDLGSGLNRDELFGLFGLEPAGPRETRRGPKPSGLELEARTAALLRRLGWTVAETPRSHDGGVDLIATRVDQIGVEECLFVQCKDHARAVGVEVVRELLGVLPTDRIVRPVLVSPAGLTGDAARLAMQRNVLVWDDERLDALEAP